MTRKATDFLSLAIPVLALGLWGCSEGSEAFLPGKVVEQSVAEKGSIERFDPRVDILFVIDDSYSMDTHQANLIRNIDEFTNVFLQKSILDYNIGVLTSSNDSFGWSDKCCGHLVQAEVPIGIAPARIVNRTTPNGDVVLKSNLKVGVDGSGTEKFFDPMHLALTPPLVHVQNAGFYRPDAMLAVVFITDTDDQSDHVTPREALDRLLALKNGDPNKLLLYSAIIPTIGATCQRNMGEIDPIRIEEFMMLAPNAGTNILSLCDPDFGKDLAAFADEIIRKTASVMYLSRPPVVETLRVTYGAIDLPKDLHKGWTFDADLNAIRLGKDIDWLSQPPGSEVKVYYDIAEYKN